MNRKLYKYIDHICNKMKLPRKARDVLKECDSKAHAKRTIRKHKKNLEGSFDNFIMEVGKTLISDSFEKQIIDGMV